MTDFSASSFLQDFLKEFKIPDLKPNDTLNVSSAYTEFLAEILGIKLNKNIYLLPFKKGEEFLLKYNKISLEDTWDIQEYIDLGYEKVERVWNPGEISELGDTILIYPYSSKNIVRLSLWGKDIERIDILEVGSRKRIETLKEIKIFSKQEEHVISNESNPDLLTLRYNESPIFESDQDIDIEIRNIPNLNIYSNSISSENIIKDYKTRGYRIWYISKDLFRFNEDNFLHQYIDRCYEINSSIEEGISKGFVYNPSKLLILTDTEVIGEVNLRYEKKDKKLDPSSIEILKKIVPGDYVVHQDHGIGKFEGLIEREEDSYIQISYAGNDKLFIPLRSSNKIMKYIGSGKALPRLTGLNSGVWKRISQKAKEDVEDIAKELLRIYALREISNTEKIVDSNQQLDEYWKFANDFEFTDTEDQYIATKKIVQDFQKDKPMDRLLVGDVGFGKTEIAMRAIFAVANCGKQVAVLAPTTVLANQHYKLFKQRFSKYPFNIQTLSRLQSNSDRSKILEDLKKGKIDILVGTHSILSKEVKFKNLSLIVIDEEQKFGVKQKEELKRNRVNTHVLSLTATPIPRTLNMALMGVRDISVLAIPPIGRKEIINEFNKFDWYKIRDCINRELKRGGQIYYLHNRVSNLEFVKEKLLTLVPQARIGVAHGRLSGDKLLSKMEDFIDHSIDILLCTTIIENGLDISNANTLIIDDVNRLGLSQMYQIRGRVGRGDKQAYACFFYDTLQGDSALRLEAIRESQSLGSGFVLSNRDLEIRGAGDILGKKQSGTINSVGYGLYTELLHEAVSNLISSKQKSS